jgi:protocatechuate 3,4-dioxygenase beta subunit
MAAADRVLGTCEGYCTGPYEGMPAQVPTGEARIAPRSEPGVPLTITGRALDADERPRAGVIVYAYQTDRQGLYPPAEPPRGAYSNHHGRLRAWVRTDADGRYTFHTIRPGSYGGNPEHIHMHVIESGCATYQIDDVVFGGEPNLERLLAIPTDKERKPAGGSGVVVLSGSESGWEGTRDIHLGRNVQGYTRCESAALPRGD